MGVGIEAGKISKLNVKKGIQASLASISHLIHHDLDSHSPRFSRSCVPTYFLLEANVGPSVCLIKLFGESIVVLTANPSLESIIYVQNVMFTILT